MQIERVPIGSVSQDPANVRMHGAKNLDAIKGSLKKFGQQKPIVVTAQGIVIAGNGTLEAAKALGWTEIDIVRTPLQGVDAVGYAIADNRSSELAEWNTESLQRTLDELGKQNFDLAAIGFDENDLDELEKFLPKNDAEESEVPAAPEKALSASGDLWEMGNHRIICGDSSDGLVVARLMEDRRATIMFTDPPYGVSIGSKNRLLNAFDKAGRSHGDIENDVLGTEDLRGVLLKAFSISKEFLADDGSVFVCSPQGGSLGMMMMMKDAGLEVRHVLNWVKNCPTFSLGRLDYDYQHEPILFTWKKTHKRVMSGAFKSSVWTVDKPRESKEHPTMKPVELPKNAILNHSDPGDVCYEPFSGSGSTIIACEQTGRRCMAVEIEPRYVDLSVKRWQNLAGKKARNLTRHDVVIP